MDNLIPKKKGNLKKQGMSDEDIAFQGLMESAKDFTEIKGKAGKHIMVLGCSVKEDSTMDQMHAVILGSSPQSTSQMLMQAALTDEIFKKALLSTAVAMNRQDRNSRYFMNKMNHEWDEAVLEEEARLDAIEKESLAPNPPGGTESDE